MKALAGSPSSGAPDARAALREARRTGTAAVRAAAVRTYRRRWCPRCRLPENAVDKAVAKLDGIAEELMRKSGIPGMAVAVVHGGKTVYAKGFGVRDATAARPANKVDADTVFQLASLSKPLDVDGGRASGRA